MDPKLYRNKSIKKVSTPEQLDQLLTVTDSRAWLALAAVGLIVLVAGAWSIVGSVATTVNGVGILVRQGGYYAATANEAGRVIELRVQPGDSVPADGIVAVVGQQDLALELQQARDRLATLETRRDRETSLADRELLLQRRRLEAQQDAAQAALETARRDAARLRDRVAELERGVRAGVVRQTELEEERGQLEAAEARIRQERVALQGIEADLIAARQQLQGALQPVEDEIVQARNRIAALEQRITQAEHVVTPIAGRIVSVEVDEGMLVQPGQQIVLVESAAAPMEALLFTAEEGRKAAPGQAAEVLPGVVNWEEYGYIEGHVADVSEIPVTQAYLDRKLANPELVAEILREVGDPYAIRVTLEPDTTAPSGFEWTSGRGPERPITSGMMATGKVVVETQRPIAYLLPIFRREVGF